MGFGGLAPRSGCRGAGPAKQTVSWTSRDRSTSYIYTPSTGDLSIRTVADQCDLTAVSCFPLQ